MFRKTTEDYLKTILGMTENSGGVRNTDLAKKLGIKKPSVTSAVKQLEEDGYVSRTENGSIILTASGMQIAKDTLRRHSTFVELLTSQGVEREIAERDACELEHDVSPESYEAFVRINELLKRKKSE